ncbi:hypothetical protein VNO77_01017 [Canavalia gladiata]|uniref:Uncharacterized protein n=1 Tax=Canavalia gladiata TaxID=3824 RepID=A0AAN9MR58_CANGL
MMACRLQLHKDHVPCSSRTTSPPLSLFNLFLFLSLHIHIFTHSHTITQSHNHTSIFNSQHLPTILDPLSYSSAFLFLSYAFSTLSVHPFLSSSTPFFLFLLRSFRMSLKICLASGA